MTIFLNKSLLITRPMHESLVFSQQIKKFNLSINTICNPLFEIENLPVDLDLSDTSGLLITSSNAIRSLIQSKVFFKGSMFCVGNSTALLAKEAGFHSVSANGNISHLVRLITRLEPKNVKKLVYCRGEEITGDLGGLLREKNYNVHEEVCYKKVPRNLSLETIDRLNKGLIVGATFFSKQTVDLFFNQVRYIPNGFIAFCISKAVSDTVLSFYSQSFLSIRVAEEPSMIEMCKLVVNAPELVTWHSS